LTARGIKIAVDRAGDLHGFAEGKVVTVNHLRGRHCCVAGRLSLSSAFLRRRIRDEEDQHGDTRGNDDSLLQPISVLFLG
jgi:hypothetical protein